MNRIFVRRPGGLRLAALFTSAPLAALFIIGLSAAAQAADNANKVRVRSDVSTRDIGIQSNFTGIEIVVFGAIDNAKSGPDLPPYDVIAVIKGPSQGVVVRRKEHVAGVWLNRRSRVFHDVPGFYAVLSTRPLRAITDEKTLKSLKIGFAALDFGHHGHESESDQLFRQALVRLRQEHKLFQDHDSGITFVGQSLFRGTVDLPVDVPIGLYTTQVFLFQSGKLLSQDSNTLHVQKVGFERLVYSLAYDHRFLYGLLAVVIALAMGFSAWTLFRRE